jgi:hypothetical protein
MNPLYAAQDKSAAQFLFRHGELHAFPYFVLQWLWHATRIALAQATTHSSAASLLPLLK